MRLLPSCLTLAAMLWLAAGPAVAGASQWRAKVHPRVLAEAERGPVEFLVFFEEQADLSFADGIADKPHKGRAVVDALRETAERAQAPLRSWLAGRGLEHRPFWIADMILVRGDLEVVESVARRPEVKRLDANPRVAVDLPDTDAVAGWEGGVIEWNVLQIGADRVWDMGFTGKDIVVAGQDTGYDWDHPAIVGAYRGWDGTTVDHDYNWHDSIHAGGGVCGTDSPEPCDDQTHGTHTMGTMVGDDGGANRIGVAPGARWIGCRNMNQGVGTPATYSECFEWLVAPTDGNGLHPDPSKAPHVVNNSWSCPPSEGCSPGTLRTVTANAQAAGIVVVVSAGNAGSACETVVDPPAIYGESFSVGATDSSDVIASFSSRGPVTVDGSYRMKPEVSAPGVSVRSSTPNGTYGFKSGTSMAGPHVAGLVALLLDARPDLIGKVKEVERLVELSAVPLTGSQTCGGVPGTDVPNNTYGFGRVDAENMLVGDADGDGTDNLNDCRPVAPWAWAAPDPVSDLTLGGGAVTSLSWSRPADPGGTAPVRYDVLRATSATGFVEATCLAADTVDTAVVDDDSPGGIFYYLVRASSACGESLGAASDGASRSASSCES